MHTPWHRRIHWARLGLVGAIALAAWSLDERTRLRHELERVRAECGCAQPSEPEPPLTAVTGRFVQVTDDVLRELGVELEPALQVSARRLRLDVSAWYGLHAGPYSLPPGPGVINIGYTYSDTHPVVHYVDWPLACLPKELGPAACASLPEGQPVTLDLVERSVIVDYELSSGGAWAIVPRPAATQVHVTGQRVGRALQLEVILESRPGGPGAVRVGYDFSDAEALSNEALQVELGSISAAAIDVSFAESPLSPRQFSLSLEPGQTVLLPGPARGEVVALGVGVAAEEDR